MILTAVRGASEVEAFRRRVPNAAVLRAVTVALLALTTVFTVAFVLTLTEQPRFLYLLFEAFSAFGTSGMSTGITPDLSAAGRVMITLTMFIGRLGPMTLIVALATREHQTSYRWPVDEVRIG